MPMNHELVNSGMRSLSTSDDEASYHEDASENGTAMEMEHYIEYIDNDVWKVIQNENSKKRIAVLWIVWVCNRGGEDSTGKDGVVRILPPVSAAEIHVVEKERKARTILLMAIPKEHLRRFHGMDDAKEILEAIRTRFGGNANSKKMQKAVLKQRFEAFTISSLEGLEKGYDRSLPSAWSNLAMTMRTKPDVDTLSIDDLYNNLRVFEHQYKVKSGHTGPYSTYTPSTSSNNIPEREVPAGFADEVIYLLFSKQSKDLDLRHEDLEHIDDVDIEEMDINWQIATIAIRMKKFYKKTGRRVRINGNKPVGFDKKKLECFKCHNTGHFARECTSKGTNDGKKRDSFYQDQGAGKKEQNQNCLLTMDDGMTSTSKVGLGYEIQSNNEVLSYEEEMNRTVFKCTKEDFLNKPLYSRFSKTDSFKGVPHPLTGDYTPKPQEEIDDSLYVYGKKGPQKPEISDSDDSSNEHSSCQSNDSEGSFGNPSEHSSESESESLSVPKEMSTSKSVTTNEKVVSEPKSTEVEPSCVTHVKTPRQQMKNQETPKVNRKNWNEMMERELGEGYSFIKKKCFVCGSLSHLIKDCDFYEKKMAREAELKKQRVFNTGNGVAKPVWNNANRVNHANHFVPRPVQLIAVRQNVNSVRPNVNTGRANVNSVRQNVNSVRSNVNTGSFNINTVKAKQPINTSNSNSFSPVRPQIHPLNNDPEACRSSLVLNQMTSDHNHSELGIQDHSNEQSSSKLVPKVVP
ncbi:ribonuclease H-like domain-containing protein [Tanacetum coccineum]